MITPYDCIVVANGRFPAAAQPLKRLHDAPALIACDGAVEALDERGITPDAIIGDMDSIPEALHVRYADRIHQVEDQEINDLTKAVLFAHKAGYRRLLILGATGLREDHTLGNISLLLEHAPLFERIEMQSDYGIFLPLLHSATLPCRPGQQVSIFSMYPCGAITVEGVRWPIRNRSLTAWWQGTLNETLNDTFTIHLTETARIIVYLAGC